jgi:hypothetical protein
LKKVKGECFISLYVAIDVLSGMQTGFALDDDPNILKYEPLLTNNLPLYAEVNDIYLVGESLKNLANVVHKPAKHLYLSGYCNLKRNEGEKKTFRSFCGKFTSFIEQLDFDNYQIFNAPNEPYLYTTLSAFFEFLISVGKPIKRPNIESFLFNTITLGEVIVASEDLTEGTNDHKGIFEILKRNSSYVDLLNILGPDYMDIADASLMAVIINQLLGFHAHDDPWDNSESTRIENQEVFQVDDEVKLPEEIDYPTALIITMSVYEDAWLNNPENMAKPTEAQLIELVGKKGISAPTLVKAIIKISKPDNIELGGKQKPDLIPWSSKN